MKVPVISKIFKKSNREYWRVLIRLWHPSAIISILLNFIVLLPTIYHGCYYRRDNWGRLFHYGRRIVQLTFLLFAFCFYMSPSSTFLFRFLIILFILIMFENIISQWASHIVFLNISPQTIFAIITTNPCVSSSLKSVWINTNEFIDGGGESLNTLLEYYETPQFQVGLDQVVNEIKENLTLIKGEVLRVTILPFKYIFSILLSLALLVMALQVKWDGEAFKGLILQNAESRSLETFCTDMMECLYFSSISVATIGYGTMAPNVSDEADRTNNCDLRFPSTLPVRGLMFLTAVILLFTIFSTFSMAFRGVDELMKRLNDPEKLKSVIKKFLEEQVKDPTRFFIE